MVFKMVDLFAGAGGFSTGFRNVCEGIGVKLDLTAVNHWPTAVETHSKNHPEAQHFCESVFEVNPRDVAPDGYLDCLTASPECIYHSNARGGGVCDEQSRSGAMDVLRWLTELNVKTLVLENVEEWQAWGPVYQRATRRDGKRIPAGYPMPHRRGEYFRQFCAGLRALGYSIDYGVLNSADYGAYTARRRLFLIAYKENQVLFPKITHAAEPTAAHLKRWHTAHDIIDWDIEGESVFKRQAGLIDGKKPLVGNTIKRILWGLENISGIDPAPFADLLYGRGPQTSIPLIGETKPFIAKYHGGAHGHTRCYGLDAPLLTCDCANRFSLIEPFIIKYFGSGANAVSTNFPLPTVTTKDRFGVVVPTSFDIRYRLLEPHELAAGMGFNDYLFAGSKTDIKKQIGNAVEVNQSTALAYSVLESWLEAA